MRILWGSGLDYLVCTTPRNHEYYTTDQHWKSLHRHTGTFRQFLQAPFQQFFPIGLKTLRNTLDILFRQTQINQLFVQHSIGSMELNGIMEDEAQCRYHCVHFVDVQSGAAQQFHHLS